MAQTEIVAEWIANLRWEDLPEDVTAQAKRCLRDHLACVAGGARSEPGRIAAALALDWGGSAEATLVGKARGVTARHAAFANATMANALDYDDTYHGHPGATTFAAGLAAAEKWQATGKEFLIAVIVGYELSFRAMALLRPLVPRYTAMWDLGTLQAYGAVATVARLAGLNAEGVANALGLISGTTPVPLPRKNRFEGEGRSMLKSAYGWASDAAVVAVELTLAGFSGPGHALDDNFAFWQETPLAGGIQHFADRLGQDWAIRHVEFKPYMACRFIHPVLQAVETLMADTPIDAAAVRQVDIDAFSLLGDEHHYILRPVSGTDAQFSVPYTVAAMLTNGKLSPESYEQTMLKDPRVLALADRVRVTTDDAFEAAYPRRLGARVRIVLDDGFSRTLTVDHPKGSADQALTDEALLEKFLDLAEPLLGPERTRKAISAIENLESYDRVHPLTSLFAFG